MAMLKVLCFIFALSAAVAQETTTEGRFMTTDYDSMNAELQDCPDDKIAFELVTGYVYSAPEDMMDSQPGILMLTDCISLCRRNSSCMSVNYETGLCVLFSSTSDFNSGQLAPSQFPVFTLYVQKTCLSEPAPCNGSWVFEKVFDMELNGYAKKTETVASRAACAQLCLSETEFPCRSVNYNPDTGECSLSDMNRHTAIGTEAFQRTSTRIEYLENNCVHDPVRMCEFQKMEGSILKTVDSVYQEIESLEECKAYCLAAPFRCHSFDYGDTGDNVCRLSHHAMATLTHIEEPYLDIPQASTYELSSCYNVTIDCRSGDMVTRIKTSKIFNGKIYSKGSPNSCVVDVDNSLEFELVMPYNDVDCAIKRDNPSRFSNDVIIQHHDTIVTSSDLGLSVHCQYDLSNKSVSNNVNLEVTGTIESSLEEGTIVESPNVIMRVTDQSGLDLKSASVGDMLELRFEIVDMNTPYEIFVRDLVAIDGTDDKRITLLDNRGCPTETNIMRELLKIDETGKILSASFYAFKFPTSDTVQFRALVTPCIPFCEPVTCNVMDFGGQMMETESYGRKKRSAPSQTSSRSMLQEIISMGPNHLDISGTYVPTLKRTRRETTKAEEVVVEQKIIISDKFGFKAAKQKTNENQKTNHAEFEDHSIVSEDVSGQCINTMGLILACALFLVAQVILVVVWTAIWQRRRHNKLEEPLSHTTTTESLRQLYDSGYPRRV